MHITKHSLNENFACVTLREYYFIGSSWSRGSVPSSHAMGQRFQPRRWQYFKLLLDPADCCISVSLKQCTEVRFARFLSGGFITAIVANPLERKLAKRTSVQWFGQ